MYIASVGVQCELHVFLNNQASKCCRVINVLIFIVTPSEWGTLRHADVVFASAENNKVKDNGKGDLIMVLLKSYISIINCVTYLGVKIQGLNLCILKDFYRYVSLNTIHI